MTEPPPPPPRVTQLDALLLDKELYSLVKGQISSVCHLLRIPHHHPPEITLALKALFLWKFKTTSLGQSLMGLRYHERDKRKLFLFFLLDGVLPYVFSHGWFRGFLSDQRLMKATTLLKTLSILNLLIFLRQSRYPTLIHRALGLTMVLTEKKANPPFGYQMREVLWRQLGDLLLIVIPLVLNTGMLRHVTKLVNKPASSSHNHASTGTCCVCRDSVVLPQKVNGCSVCYYCYKTTL